MSCPYGGDVMGSGRKALRPYSASLFLSEKQDARSVS
jgi:hypothetical protein